MLSYYRLEKTKECEIFFFTNDGYFNFWDEYLMMRIRESNIENAASIVLVNRPGTVFHGNTNNINKKDYQKNLDESITALKPEEMFKDFPELKEYRFVIK